MIDTGVDHTHPELAANMWLNDRETPLNSADEDGNGYSDDLHGYDFATGNADPADAGDHGTHVAGTIAAVGENQAGIIGLDDKVRILALKVSGDGSVMSSSAIIDALQYATALKNRGVNIVALNASYGGGGYSTPERAAIQAAGDAGIILCAAAGNSSANNDSTVTYPANYRLPNMIVVAASDQNDALAGYSNYGATTVDLAAPGSNILSTKPSTVSLISGGTTYNPVALTYSGTTTGFSGAIVDCGTGNTASEFPSSVKGNIALIQRGTQTFAIKVGNAMTAGARAVMIYNNANGAFTGTLQAAGNWIPAYSISQADGQSLKSGLSRNGSLVLSGGYQFMDGTSMATPHVTGAVAFAAMNFPGETVAQRRQRVLNAVDIKPGLKGKAATGGRLNLLRMIDTDTNGLADWQPSIITRILPQGIQGTAYMQALAATSGVAPYRWTLAGGSLPAGFTLNGSGVLIGSSGAPGSYPFTAQVADSLGTTANQLLTLNIATTGPLDHFTWDYFPTTLYAGTRFAVRITARDSAGRAIPSYSGKVTLSAATPEVAEIASTLSVSPNAVSFSEGSFVGYLTVPAPAANLALTAADNTATGRSNSVTVQSAASTAGDGLPDAWKLVNGLGLSVNAASLDSDGDGMSNQREYNAGTDPLSATSRLRVTGLATDSKNTVTLQFSALAGKLYRVSTSDDLLTWTPLSSPAILPTATGTQTVTLPYLRKPAAFYRVEIVP